MMTSAAADHPSCDTHFLAALNLAEKIRRVKLLVIPCDGQSIRRRRVLRKLFLILPLSHTTSAAGRRNVVCRDDWNFKEESRPRGESHSKQYHMDMP